MGSKTLYICKTEYLKEQGFEGHIKNVKYWYRKVFNVHRGKSASERLREYNSLPLPHKEKE